MSFSKKIVFHYLLKIENLLSLIYPLLLTKNSENKVLSLTLVLKKYVEIIEEYKPRRNLLSGIVVVPRKAFNFLLKFYYFAFEINNYRKSYFKIISYNQVFFNRIYKKGFINRILYYFDDNTKIITSKKNIRNIYVICSLINRIGNTDYS